MRNSDALYPQISQSNTQMRNYVIPKMYQPNQMLHLICPNEHNLKPIGRHGGYDVGFEPPF